MEVSGELRTLATSPSPVNNLVTHQIELAGWSPDSVFVVFEE